jgi:hypothetical protein
MDPPEAPFPEHGFRMVESPEGQAIAPVSSQAAVEIVDVAGSRAFGEAEGGGDGFGGVIGMEVAEDAKDLAFSYRQPDSPLPVGLHG